MLDRRTALGAGALAGSIAVAGWRSAPPAAAGDMGRAGAGAPRTIPAVREHAPGRTWRPTSTTRIVLTSPDDAQELASAARTLRSELHSEGHVRRPPEVVVVSPGVSETPRDLVLRIGRVAGSDSPEAYRIGTGRGLRITGASATGVFHGTRTLLQALRLRGGFTGEVTDHPAYTQRGLMIDVGRKYFTPGWLEDRIRELSWLKLNVLHLHLSDSLGFRIESESHPEIVTHPALTKAEVRRLIEVAERYHVTLIPEIDSPGHMAAILEAHPELQLVRKDGRREPANLDYSKPAARRLMADLIGEYAELFPGPTFHLGGDEYFGYPWDPDRITGENAPQLLDYARAEAGPRATLLDGFTSYTNDLVARLAAQGKRAKVWNDHVVPGEGVVELDRRAEVEVWIRWNTEDPSVRDYVDAGYDVVNGHGDHLYFILAPGQQHESGKKSAQGVYDLWTPRTFMRSPGEDLRLEAEAPMSGAHLSIWCDNPDFQSEQEIAEGVRPWLRSFAQQMWGSPRTAPLYEQFVPLIDAVGDAPAAVGTSERS